MMNFEEYRAYDATDADDLAAHERPRRITTDHGPIGTAGLAFASSALPAITTRESLDAIVRV